VMRLFKGGEKIEEGARAVAGSLGLRFFVFDFTEAFAENVITPFINDYRQGRTPNPCLFCNRHIKFGQFLDKALDMGKDCIVTGHYARVESCPSGRYLLKKGVDAGKDQSYVLYTLTQEQLKRTVFPLGGLMKSQVREIARDTGFEYVHGTESQDICFIPDGDYAGFITDHTGTKPQAGRFIDSDGNDLGENRGVISYTVGQRRGLGLAMSHPLYVLEIRPEDNTVVLGKDEQLYSKLLTVRDINLITTDQLESQLRAFVKIRYSDPGHMATVYQTEPDTLRIEFDEPQRAITKGQAAVIYDGDIVIGGGTIV